MVAHADPASELPACAVALGATIELEGPDGARRIVEAREFFEGTWTTTLRADELLVAVHWPTAGPRAGSAVVEVARRHGDFAIAGAAVHVELDENDRVERVGFGLFGLDATPVPADEARAAVLGARSDELDVRGIGELAATTCSPSNDVHATAAQRRRIAAHVTSSALERALHCALAPREEAPRA